MARFPFEATLTDQYGRIIVGGTVTVNLTGTSTAATIYAAESGGSAITDSQITTGSDGTYKFWVDTLDFVATQRFRLVLDGGSPFVPRTIDDVVIILSIEVTAGSTTTFMNKTIDADDNTLSNLEIGAEVKSTVVTSDLNLAGLNLDDVGVIFLKEQVAADSNVAGSGQIWVKTASPNTLQFSDDVGTDFRLSFSTSAQLATMVSDETGSGALVFAISPTLVTPSSDDITLTGTTETDTNTLTKGNIIKGWINFNMSGSGTINASYNVASIADVATGKWTVNWDTNFADANAAVIAINNESTMALTVSIVSPAVGSHIIQSYNSGSLNDSTVISVIVIGNQ